MLTDRYIKIDGVNVRYWDYGHSESVILLVHGLNASIEYWEYNIEALAKNHRVIALDLIGFGKTDKPEIDYTMNIYPPFLNSFMDALDLKSVNLVGHSLGGAVVILFSSLYPERVRRLILVSSAGFHNKIPLGFRMLTVPLAGRVLSLARKLQMEHFIKKFIYNKPAITKDFIDRVYQIYQEFGARKTMLRIVKNHANLRGIRQPTLDEIQTAHNKLTMPILIIWGKNDKLLLPKGAAKAKQLLPHAQLVFFDHCGHIPQVEYPKRFNELLLHFINTSA